MKNCKNAKSLILSYLCNANPLENNEFQKLTLLNKEFYSIFHYQNKFEMISLKQIRMLDYNSLEDDNNSKEIEK